ncbi:unnamed protein product [Orchesella dallaii]|uniref:ADP-ribosylation factor-like protein 6-interacting protein 1 n=1 Tax=Orchesella dallaii TaxID=48710 RepID=A0ABP1R5B8_9HEXA
MESTGKRNRKKTVPFQYGVFPPFDPQNVIAGSEDSLMEKGENREESEQERPREHQAQVGEAVAHHNFPLFEMENEERTIATAQPRNSENFEDLLKEIDVPQPISASSTEVSIVGSASSYEGVSPLYSSTKLVNNQDLLKEIDVPQPISASSTEVSSVGSISPYRVVSPLYNSSKIVNDQNDTMRPRLATVLSDVGFEEPVVRVNATSIANLSTSSVNGGEFETAFETTEPGTGCTAISKENDTSRSQTSEITFSECTNSFRRDNLWLTLMPMMKEQVKNLLSWEKPWLTLLVTFAIVVIARTESFDFLPFVVGVVIPLMIVVAAFLKLIFGDKIFEPYSNFNWNLPEVYVSFVWDWSNQLISSVRGTILIEDPIKSVGTLIVCVTWSSFCYLTVSDTIIFVWMMLLPFTFIRKITAHLRIGERTVRLNARFRNSFLFQRKRD